MRIVILTQYFAPEMGAPQSRLLELAQGLQRNGWEVLVITALPNYPTGRIFKEYAGRFSMRDTIQGIPVRRYWLYPSISTSSLKRIASMVSFSITSFFAVRAIRTFRPDYLLSESPPLTLAYTGLQLARLSGAKHIMNISDLWPLTALELGAISDGLVYRQAVKLERMLYRRSFVCFGQSQQIIDHVEKNGARRVYLFRNGVDPSRFQPQPFTIHPAPLKVVYAGLLGVAQNVLQICQSIDFREAGMEFHIYGNGAQQEEIRTFLNAHPDKGIVLHEPVDRKTIGELLPDFDGSLIPLAREIKGAVPSKIYESMAAGVPILFTGGGEGERIIADNKLGWTAAPGNMDALKQILQDFAKEPEKRKQAKENCIRAAHTLFNRNLQIDQLSAYLHLHSTEKN